MLRSLVMRTSILCLALALGFTAALGPVRVQEPTADASVSTAATLEGLVTFAHVVALAEPTESRTEWQNGKIVTYTRLSVIERVSGEGPAAVWVKSLGGTVGDIGQSVEGEPTFAKGTRSLVFLRRLPNDAGAPDAHVVVSRAQGQYPLALEKARWMVRSNVRVGMILPPREAADTPVVVLPKQAALARLRDRPVDDVLREVRDLWTQVHAKKTP